MTFVWSQKLRVCVKLVCVPMENDCPPLPGWWLTLRPASNLGQDTLPAQHLICCCSISASILLNDNFPENPRLHWICSVFSNCCFLMYRWPLKWEKVFVNWTFWLLHIGSIVQCRDCTDFINAPLLPLGLPSKRHISEISIMHTFPGNIYKQNLWTQYLTF